MQKDEGFDSTLRREKQLSGLSMMQAYETRTRKKARHIASYVPTLPVSWHRAWEKCIALHGSHTYSSTEQLNNVF